jgi:transposase
MKKRKAHHRRLLVQHKQIKLEEINQIVERAKNALSEEQYNTLKQAVATLAIMTEQLENKATTIERLRQILFGASTEKIGNVLGDSEPSGTAVGTSDGSAAAEQPDGTGAQASAGDQTPDKPKAPGHGRNGAAAYRGADRVKVEHPSLKHGDRCPGCFNGKVYQQGQPATLVRITGMAPLHATVYERERLRCNLCGEVFTADSPPEVGDKKYDEGAGAMVDILKYGVGTPFNRIEKLQQAMGIPMPASTQWELVEHDYQILKPVHQELIRQAAQAKLLHNDDTTMKILEYCKAAQRAEQAQEGTQTDERSGVFTSGIVAKRDDNRLIALYFTGKKHAGENLIELLAKRDAQLPDPIQMCDALSRNMPAQLKTILANCMAHARRKFVEQVNNFPEECRYLLEKLRDVYHNDSLTRQRNMSDDERLSFHQLESGPIMEDLQNWLCVQIDEHKVEPNSGLGEAIGYMTDHWSKLTLFLRVPGAPLDNNICERILKKAILHRKNALFYKTQNGANVGDLFMSFIHTAELNGVEAFDYLVTLLKHPEQIAESPGDWMPWNYRQTLARLAQPTAPSG